MDRGAPGIYLGPSEGGSATWSTSSRCVVSCPRPRSVCGRTSFPASVATSTDGFPMTRYPWFRGARRANWVARCINHHRVTSTTTMRPTTIRQISPPRPTTTRRRPISPPRRPSRPLLTSTIRRRRRPFRRPRRLQLLRFSLQQPMTGLGLQQQLSGSILPLLLQGTLRVTLAIHPTRVHAPCPSTRAAQQPQLQPEIRVSRRFQRPFRSDRRVQLLQHNRCRTSACFRLLLGAP